MGIFIDLRTNIRHGRSFEFLNFFCGIRCLSGDLGCYTSARSMNHYPTILPL